MTAADHAVAVPALPLRSIVSHYAGSRLRDVPEWQHAGLPSRYIDLIVSLARPIEIARMPGAQSPGAYRAFVAGLQQAPALVRMGGDLDCLHVFLQPNAARALLGVGGRELASQVIHLADPHIIGFSRRHFAERFSSEFGISPRQPLAFFGSSVPAVCSFVRLVASPTSRWPVASTIRPTWYASGMRWRAARPGNGSSASSRFYKTAKSAEVMIDSCESSRISV